MKVTKTKINQRMQKKNSSVLVETIFLAKKNNLINLAKAISVSTRRQAKVSLEKINNTEAKEVIIPGKVLSNGEINKKIKVYALGFSEKAKEKLKKAGCEYKIILEALQKKEKLNGEILI